MSNVVSFKRKVLGKNYNISIKNLHNKALPVLKKCAWRRIYYNFVQKPKFTQMMSLLDHDYKTKGRGRPKKYNTEEERHEAYRKQQREFDARRRKMSREKLKKTLIHTADCEICED
jgi:hypothetical protein